MTDKVFEYTTIDETLASADAFAAATGIERGELIVSRYVNVPVPAWPEAWPEGHRRWVGTIPEALTSPLCWLPDELAGRLTVDGQVEPDDHWVIRVCLALEARGWLSPETGLFGNVLERHGIDLDDESVYRSAVRWLHGDDAPSVFDTIGLGAASSNDELSTTAAAASGIIDQNSHLIESFDTEDFLDSFSDLRSDLASGLAHSALPAIEAVIDEARECYPSEQDQTFWVGLRRRYRSTPETVISEALRWLNGRLDELSRVSA